MTKLILITSIAVGSVMFVPRPVAAASCTDDYEKCLNDSHDKKGVARMLADIECMARYIGCVRDVL